MRILKHLLVLIGLAAVLWFGAHWYAEYRVRSAFAEAGLSDEAAACMGKRLVRKLSLLELRKLEAFQQEKHSVHGLLRAARNVGDHHVMTVTTSSVALCTSGFAS